MTPAGWAAVLLVAVMAAWHLAAAIDQRLQDRRADQREHRAVLAQLEARRVAALAVPAPRVRAVCVQVEPARPALPTGSEQVR